MKYKPRLTLFALLVIISALLLSTQANASPQKQSERQLVETAQYLKGQPRNIVWSPDSQYFFIPTTVSLWIYDVDDIANPVEFAVNDNMLGSTIAFSEDGSLVASSSVGSGKDVTFGFTSTVYVWDFASFEVLNTFQPEAETNILDYVFTPDDLLIAGGTSTIVHVWDVHSGEEVNQFAGIETSIRALAYSPAHDLIAVGGHNGFAFLINASTGEITTLDVNNTEQKAVAGVAFSDDESQLFTVAEGGVAKVWDVATQEDVTPAEFEGMGAYAYSGIHKFDDGRYRLHAQSYGTAAVDPVTLEWEGNSVSTSPNGEWGVDFDEAFDFRLKLTDGAGRTIIETTPFPRLTTLDAVSDDGVFVYGMIGNGATIVNLEENTGRVFNRYSDSLSSDYAFLPEQNALALDRDGQIGIFDFTDESASNNLEPLYTLTGFDSYLPAVAFSNDGRLLVDGYRFENEDYTAIAQIWDWQNSELLAQLVHTYVPEEEPERLPQISIKDIVFSPDDSHVYTLMFVFPKTMVLHEWDVASGELLRTLSLPDDIANNSTQIAMHPDGSSLVLAGGTGVRSKIGNTVITGGRVYILDIASFEFVSTNETNHDHQAVDVNFSPDGSMFATVGNRTIFVWDSATGEILAQGSFIADAESVIWLNNTELLTTAEDAVIRRWEVQ